MEGWHTPHLTSAVEVLVVPLAVVRLLPPIPLVPRAVRPRVVARLEPLLLRVRARVRARARAMAMARARARAEARARAGAKLIKGRVPAAR